MRTTMLAAFALMALIAVPARADEIVIRFSHVVGTDTPKGIGANLFKEKVAERLAGKVRVAVYPRSQKFTDDQVLLALLFGDVEMAAPSLAKFRSYSKSLQVFDLPFLFKDLDAVHAFQRGKTGRALLDSMIPRGIKGLAYWDNGARVISASRPLRVPDDAKGLIFRIEPSAVFQEQYARLGAVAIPMPFKRVTDAVREGLVKGQENAWSNIYSRRLHRFQRHFTEVGHSFLGYMVVTSDAFWQGLPADIRVELESILDEVTAEVNRLAGEKAESDRRAVAAAEGVEVLRLTPAERKAWRQRLTPVWKTFEAEIGTEVIKAAQAANAP